MVCQVCKEDLADILFQHVKCSDSTEEHEVCTNCKSDFLTLQYGFLGKLGLPNKYKKLIRRLYGGF